MADARLRLIFASGIAIVGGCIFVEEPCACSPGPTAVVPVSGTVVSASGARVADAEVTGSLYDGYCPTTIGGPSQLDFHQQRTSASGTFRFELRDYLMLDSACVRVAAARAIDAAPATIFTKRVRVGRDAARRPLDSVRVTLTLPAP